MKSVLFGLSFVCLVGCVSSTQTEKTENSMLGDWLVEPPLVPGTCASINGDFQILGLGKLNEGVTLEEMRLDVALGYTFPSHRMPSRVNVEVDERANILKFQFSDPVNETFSQSIKCSNGWYKFEQRQSDQYLGDGGYLDYSIRRVSLGKGRDGSLLVHLKLEGQFSSLGVLKSREVSESWSMYMTSE